MDHAQDEPPQAPSEASVAHIQHTPSDKDAESDPHDWQSTIKETLDKLYTNNSSVSVVTVNFVDERSRPIGAVLIDSGAQINIENDLKCFVGYLEPSDVVIGLAKKSATLRNCGVGTREKRFRDHRGNVYIRRDKAYYCPDAPYPIMTTGDWEEEGATVILNPGKKFRKTNAGTHLPVEGKTGLIITDDERVLVMTKVDGVQNLYWLIPIQPTTVTDLEQNRIQSRNETHVANLLRTLDEAADGPSVEEYATVIKDIEQKLEEAHLIHS